MNPKMAQHTVAVLTTVIVTALVGNAAEKPKPNIVVIYTDDQRCFPTQILEISHNTSVFLEISRDIKLRPSDPN